MKGGEKMKKLIIAALISGVALLGVQAQASANLLGNPGFDDPSAAPWGTWGQGSATITIGSTEEYRSPSKSLKLSMLSSSVVDDYGTAFQSIPFSVGQTLYGTGYIKGTLDANTQAYAQFGFWGGNKLDMAKGPIFSAATINDWYMIPQFTAVVPGAVQGVPTDRVEYGFVILANAGGATGTAYFDDAYADSTPIPEPTSILLLGTGLVGLFGFSRRKRG
jgi:hypothetical protein